ncbi:MAG: TRAP transporter small permease [Spirochaetaceae bacterium]|jgi:TRAP-type C4-dicarboxylate transport system permease small subunit|nr:TRAP transporter small permease [Spirochaetaceae bacterium]
MNKRLRQVLVNLDFVISGTMLAVLVLYTFFGVIMRYFFNRPVLWGEELQLFCIVIIVFFGAGAAFRTGSHVAIDIVVDRFPRKLQYVFEFFIYAISMMVFIYFALQSASFVRQMYVTKRTTDILNIPFFLTYSAFPLGCVLMMVNYTLTVYRRIFGKEEQS